MERRSLFWGAPHPELGPILDKHDQICPNIFSNMEDERMNVKVI
jgi:hypothetical protein